jgi:hypothetical protein
MSLCTASLAGGRRGHRWCKVQHVRLLIQRQIVPRQPRLALIAVKSRPGQRGDIVAQSGSMDATSEPVPRTADRSTCPGRATPRTPRPTALWRRSASPTTPGPGSAAFRPCRAGVAAVAVCAHSVLRIAVLLLRLQQDHHQAPRQAPPYLRYLSARSTCTWQHLGLGQTGHAAAPGWRHAHLPVSDDELRELMNMLRRSFNAGAGRRILHRGRSAHRRCPAAGDAGASWVSTA